jgi:hypothetical protein
LLASARGFMLLVTKDKRVEALKPVPRLGHLWGGWSQWRNRLPQAQQQGVARVGCVLLILSVAIIGLPRQRSGGTNGRDFAP